jgi:hypothetical protein
MTELLGESAAAADAIDEATRQRKVLGLGLLIALVAAGRCPQAARLSAPRSRRAA